MADKETTTEKDEKAVTERTVIKQSRDDDCRDDDEELDKLQTK